MPATSPLRFQHTYGRLVTRPRPMRLVFNFPDPSQGGHWHSNGGGGASQEPQLNAPMTARRMALDGQFGAYSEHARIAAMDEMVARHNFALRRAFFEHYGGHQRSLSVASLASHIERNADGTPSVHPSHRAQAEARQMLTRLHDLSEWSLLHGAGHAPLHADGTMTLYHGVHGRPVQDAARELARGRYHEGTSLSSDHRIAEDFSRAYAPRHNPYGVHVLQARVPASAIIVHDALIHGLSAYTAWGGEHEYVLGRGVKLSSVSEA